MLKLQLCIKHLRRKAVAITTLLRASSVLQSSCICSWLSSLAKNMLA